MKELRQLTPTLLCIVMGVIVGAAGSAVYTWRFLHEQPTFNGVIRHAMLGGVVGTLVGVVWNVILLRRQEVNR